MDSTTVSVPMAVASAEGASQPFVSSAAVGHSLPITGITGSLELAGAHYSPSASIDDSSCPNTMTTTLMDSTTAFSAMAAASTADLSTQFSATDISTPSEMAMLYETTTSMTIGSVTYTAYTATTVTALSITTSPTTYTTAPAAAKSFPIFVNHADAPIDVFDTMRSVTPEAYPSKPVTAFSTTPSLTAFTAPAEAAAKSFPIFVKPPNAPVEVFNPIPSTTVAELRDFVSDVCHIPASLSRLQHGTKCLKVDSMTMEQCGVYRDSTVQVLLNVLGGGKRTREMMKQLQAMQKQMAEMAAQNASLSAALAKATNSGESSSESDSGSSSESSDSSSDSSSESSDEDYNEKPRKKGKGKAKAPPRKKAKAPPRKKARASADTGEHLNFSSVLDVGREIVRASATNVFESICATKNCSQTGSDSVTINPSSISVTFKYACLRDEMHIIDSSNRDNPDWVVQASRYESVCDGLQYLYNIKLLSSGSDMRGMLGESVCAYMCIDDKYSAFLRGFVGGAYPMLNDGRDIDEIKPCHVCGLTGRYNNIGKRSEWVECEGDGCCTVPNDCHAACAFGHSCPTDSDTWVCRDCSGKDPVIYSDGGITMSEQLDSLQFEEVGAGAFQLVSVVPAKFPNMFGIVSFPSVPEKDEPPIFVDINYLMESAVKREQNVLRGNIRPLSSHPKTMVMNQRFHESCKHALPKSMGLSDEMRTFVWCVACHGTNMNVGTYTDTMKRPCGKVNNCPDACDHAKKLCLPTKKVSKRCKCHLTCNWVVWWYPGLANTLSLMSVYSSHFDVMLGMLKCLDPDQHYIDSFVAQWIENAQPYPPMWGQHFGTEEVSPMDMHVEVQWLVREEHDGNAKVAYTGSLGTDHWCKELTKFAHVCGLENMHVIFALDSPVGKKIAPAVYLIRGCTAVSQEIVLDAVEVDEDGSPVHLRAHRQVVELSSDEEEDEEYVQEADDEDDSESESESESESPAPAPAPKVFTLENEPFKDNIEHPDFPTFVILLMYGKYPKLIGHVQVKLAAIASVGPAAARTISDFMVRMSPVPFTPREAVQHWIGDLEVAQMLTRGLLALCKSHAIYHKGSKYFDLDKPAIGISQCLARAPWYDSYEDNGQRFRGQLMVAGDHKSTVVVMGGSVSMACDQALDVDLVVYEQYMDFYPGIEDHTGGVDTRVIVPFSWRMAPHAEYYSKNSSLYVFSTHSRFEKEASALLTRDTSYCCSWPTLHGRRETVTIVTDHDDIGSLSGKWDFDERGPVCLYTNGRVDDSDDFGSDSSDSSDSDTNNPLLALANASESKVVHLKSGPPASGGKVVHLKSGPPAPSAGATPASPASQVRDNAAVTIQHAWKCRAFALDSNGDAFPLGLLRVLKRRRGDEQRIYQSLNGTTAAAALAEIPPVPQPVPRTARLQLFVKGNPNQDGLSFEFNYDSSQEVSLAFLIASIDVPDVRNSLFVPESATLTSISNNSGAGIGESIRGFSYVPVADFLRLCNNSGWADPVYLDYAYPRALVTFFSSSGNDIRGFEVMAPLSSDKQSLARMLNTAAMRNQYGVSDGHGIRLCDPVPGVLDAGERYSLRFDIVSDACPAAERDAVVAAMLAADFAREQHAIAVACAARAATVSALRYIDAASRDAEVSAEVSKCLGDLVGRVEVSVEAIEVATDPFKTLFEFDKLTLKKLKRLAQRLKKTESAEPFPPMNKGKGVIAAWLKQLPENDLRPVVLDLLPMSDLSDFIAAHL